MPQEIHTKVSLLFICCPVFKGPFSDIDPLQDYHFTIHLEELVPNVLQKHSGNIISSHM